MDTFTIQILIGLLGVIALGVYAIAAAVWLRGDDPERTPNVTNVTNSAAPSVADSVEAGWAWEHELAKLKDELLEEFDRLRGHITAYANTPVQVTLAATTVPLPSAPEAAPPTLASSFPNADALRAIVNMMGTGLTQKVSVDDVQIHAGFGPGMNYITQPDGTVELG